MEIFHELAIIIFIATAVSVVMKLLKQPLIVGYILSGILAGPYVFDALHSTEFIDILSKMGITILLFIVGLNMSPKVIKEVGKVSLLTGLGASGCDHSNRIWYCDALGDWKSGEYLYCDCFDFQ